MALTNPMDVNVASGGTGAHAQNIADQFIPEVWGPAILDAFDRNTTLLGLCNDYSAQLAGGGDTINLPVLGNVAVQAAPTQGSALAVDQTGSDTSESLQLVVNKHTVAQLWLPDIVKIQASYQLTNMYAERLGYAMAQAVENHIMHTVISDSTFSTTSGGDSTTTIDMADSMSGKFDDIHKVCLEESGTTAGWSLVLGPTLYASLTAVATSAGFTYGTDAPLGAGYARTGFVGTLLGMPVYMSNNAYMDQSTVAEDTTRNIAEFVGLDADDGTADTPVRGLLIHNSALHCAFSKKADLKVTYEHMYLSNLMTSDAVYGCKLRNTDAALERRAFVLHS